MEVGTFKLLMFLPEWRRYSTVFELWKRTCIKGGSFPPGLTGLSPSEPRPGRFCLRRHGFRSEAGLVQGPPRSASTLFAAVANNSPRSWFQTRRFPAANVVCQDVWVPGPSGGFRQTKTDRDRVVLAVTSEPGSSALMSCPEGGEVWPNWEMLICSGFKCCNPETMLRV